MASDDDGDSLIYSLLSTSTPSSYSTHFQLNTNELQLTGLSLEYYDLKCNILTETTCIKVLNP